MELIKAFGIMYKPEIKKQIRKRALSIMGTYRNDGDYKNGKVIDEMKYYLRAVKYIMKHGGYEAAKGDYWQNYIGEVGKWVKVSYLKYLWLKINGYKVREK